jgi:hypothetical protein
VKLGAPQATRNPQAHGVGRRPVGAGVLSRGWSSRQLSNDQVTPKREDLTVKQQVIPEGTGPVKWQIREIFLVFGVLSVLPLPGHHARRRADGVNDGAPAAERGRTILTPSSGGA